MLGERSDTGLKKNLNAYYKPSNQSKVAQRPHSRYIVLAPLSVELWWRTVVSTVVSFLDKARLRNRYNLSLIFEHCVYN